MQKLKTVTLAEGDSVLVVRNLKTEESYDVELVHNFVDLVKMRWPFTLYSCVAWHIML